MEKRLSDTGGGGGLLRGLERHVSVTSAKVVVCRLLRTVYTVVMEGIPFAKIPPLCELQANNGLTMGGSAYKNNSFYDDAIKAMAECYCDSHTSLLETRMGPRRCGIWYSSDGSSSITNHELEIGYIGTFDFVRHKAVFEFFSLDEVNLTLSDDGESPDASAIFGTQMGSLERRFGSEYKERVEENSVAVSFDGASVMIGKDNSVSTRWLEAAPQVVCLHAVAHRLESAYADAASEVPFMLFIGELVQDCYNIYSASMKQTAAFRAMAKVLELSPVSLKPLHGIRWMASQVRAVEALLRDYQVLCAHLEKAALDKVGCALKTSSRSEDFLQKKISLAVDWSSTPKSGRIVRVVKNTGGGGNAARGGILLSLQDMFVVKLDRTLRAESAAEVSISKNEAVLALAAGKQEELRGVKEWDLYLALTQFRTVATLHFVFDLESTLKVLSLTFQGEDLTPSSILNAISETYVQLELMKIVDGRCLASFYDKFDVDKEEFDGFNLEDQTDGKEMFDQDRADLIDSVLLYMHGRFDPLLNHPILLLMRNSFEHRLWPPEGAARDNWGVEELKAFASHFSGLACLRGFNVEEALHQWGRMKRELSGEPFFTKPYKAFYEHVSAHYDNILGFPDALILARLTLLILADTSCNERGFAENNRLHTATRASLKTETCRSVFEIKHYGPSSAEFNAEEMYEKWMGFVTSGDARPKRRNLAALMRKTMAAAQSMHDDGIDAGCASSSSSV
jgi:hypothetical protein